MVESLRQRYGASWTTEQVAAVRAIVERHARSAAKLREVPLGNADVPFSLAVPPHR